MLAINPEAKACLPGPIRHWTPAVIDGGAGAAVPDCDREEIWYWFIARIRSRGSLAPDLARLVALLNWRDRAIESAVHLARLAQEPNGSEAAAEAHVQYLAADILAQWALEPDRAQAPHDAPLRVVMPEPGA